jgi:hypothetical protein
LKFIIYSTNYQDYIMNKAKVNTNEFTITSPPKTTTTSMLFNKKTIHELVICIKHKNIVMEVNQPVKYEVNFN